MVLEIIVRENRMDNPQTEAALGTRDVRENQWTIQTVAALGTQDVRENRMDNPQTMAALGTHDKDKKQSRTKHNTTQKT
jgi:hypothetical protein